MRPGGQLRGTPRTAHTRLEGGSGGGRRPLWTQPPGLQTCRQDPALV